MTPAEAVAVAAFWLGLAWLLLVSYDPKGGAPPD